MIHDILSRLNAEGYPLIEFIPDGKLHRFEIEKGDRQAGFYIGHRNFLLSTGEEYYVVKYGSWREGLDNVKSINTLKGIPTNADKKTIEEQNRKQQKEIEKIKRHQEDNAAKECQSRWDALRESDYKTSEYLIRKGISEFQNLGVHFDSFTQEITIPLRDISYRITSLQTINWKGEKRFFSGAKVKGSFHVFGALTDNIVVCLCEGFATAATVFAATGYTSVFALSAENLKNVADSISKKYPNSKLIICGDNDTAGREKAEMAAKVSGAKIVFPFFKTEKEGIKKTDFNDLYLDFGLDEVRKQISAIEPSKALEEFDPYYILNHPYPDENEAKMTRVGTKTNVKELLRRLKITVRYNVVKKDIAISIPGLTTSIDNRDVVQFNFIADWCKRARIPILDLDGHLIAIADENFYNPAANWIESIPWDGTSRLEEFYNTIKSESPIKNLLMRKWLISAIAALYEPDGVYSGGVLVLQGAQYIGKTAWFKSLAPRDLNVLCEGKTLCTTDKDSIMDAIRHWIVELGELDGTFSKSEMAQLKAFLTRTEDVIRLPYGKRSSNYPRRTVFFASVNDENFLVDKTGNRRFWVIPCSGIDFEHKTDMQQLWAEVREFYLNGESWKLTHEENKLLNESNEQFEVENPIAERVMFSFDWEDPRRIEMSATEACIKMGILFPTKTDLRAVSAAIQKISNIPLRKSNGKKLLSVAPLAYKREDQYSVRD